MSTYNTTILMKNIYYQNLKNNGTMDKITPY